MRSVKDIFVGGLAVKLGLWFMPVIRHLRGGDRRIGNAQPPLCSELEANLDTNPFSKPNNAISLSPQI